MEFSKPALALFVFVWGATIFGSGMAANEVGHEESCERQLNATSEAQVNPRAIGHSLSDRLFYGLGRQGDRRFAERMQEAFGESSIGYVDKSAGQQEGTSPKSGKSSARTDVREENAMYASEGNHGYTAKHGLNENRHIEHSPVDGSSVANSAPN